MAQQKIHENLFTHELSMSDRVARFSRRLPHNYLHSPHAAIVHKCMPPNPFLTDCLRMQ